ncbi:MAG: ABC transporter ATP-binding protein [Methanomassiliicoccales archaeon]|nr:ABC transporter ATP-binding protein [Methanomassiliicoccales archaeon]MDD7479612.1 ABC transporter ATP-binding protein [Methanomassiliicoccales archaeon]
MSFSYNKREILRDVDISVDEGEIVSLLGPNGVGKTTLMKCLCGILKPSHGKVMVNNTDLSNISLRDRSKLIAYVPQRVPRIHFTVMDYILVGRRPYIDVNVRKEDMDVVWEVVHAMDLDRFAVKYLDTLSGGEFQKVQIARALVQEAGTLLLDGPTSNLDISNAYETMHIIRDIARERNVGVIMIAHDLNMAIHLSDRLVLMKNGTVFTEIANDGMTEDIIREVYNIDTKVVDGASKPYVVPRD